MSALAWILLGASIAWVIAAVVVVRLLGPSIKRRDQQVPHSTPQPEGAAMPVRQAPAQQRHALLGDLIGELLDQADVSVTVKYRGTAEAPTFGLAHLAKVLDEAGLIDDTRVGGEQ